MSSNQIGIGAKLGLVAFGLVIGLFAGNFALGLIKPTQPGTEFESLEDLRMAMLRPQERGEKVTLRHLITPHQDDGIIYELKPNLQIEFEGVPVRTSSCGLRGPERTPAKAPGVYRIALLGDSFTFGWGVEEDKIFAQVIEQNLNRVGKGERSYEVLNFGVPGYSTYQEVRSFQDKGLDFQPDAVLVFFIENDFALPFYVRDINNPGQILPSTNFTRLLQKALDPRLEEYRAEMKGMDPNSALRQLADLTKERGIKLFFTINPKKDWRKYKKRLWILDERPDIRMISLRDSFMRSVEVGEIDPKDLTLPTDPHPSALKHRLLGDLLSAHLMEAAL